MLTPALESTPTILSVSELNNTVRLLLEETFTNIWVEGEISNFAAPHSGHWYFSLKDANAQVRCAMFRAQQRNLGYTPKEGSHVLVKCKVSLYPNRGDYQLIVEHMEERGEGKLQRAFEQLKKKLFNAGLFNEEHKQPLPALPLCIGVVTSPTGAAVRDIITVLKRRYPHTAVIIYPSLVQGGEAAASIVNAIKIANQRKECDLLIVGRGGGSLEDLWPFNEEIVAYAIYESEIPIISAVGHEVDFTIADFVADLRAPTPSAAAELATPDQADLLLTLQQSKQRLLRQIKSKLKAQHDQVGWIDKHLQQQHPKRRLTEKMQKLDYYELTLAQLQVKLISRYQTKMHLLSARLQHQHPQIHIQQAKHQLSLLREQLNVKTNNLLSQRQHQLAHLAGTLDALSPLATLKRGYAIANTEDHHVITNANTVKKGDAIQVRLMQGSLDCTVEKVN